MAPVISRAWVCLIVCALASTAGAEPIRWAHPDYQSISLVRAYDATTGELVAEVLRDEPLEVPDRDSVTVSVVLADTGEESPRSGTLSEECWSWDANGDGLIGGPDFTAFAAEWSGEGYLWTAFASWWLTDCAFVGLTAP